MLKTTPNAATAHPATVNVVTVPKVAAVNGAAVVAVAHATPKPVWTPKATRWTTAAPRPMPIAQALLTATLVNAPVTHQANALTPPKVKTAPAARVTVMAVTAANVVTAHPATVPSQSVMATPPPRQKPLKHPPSQATSPRSRTQHLPPAQPPWWQPQQQPPPWPLSPWQAVRKLPWQPHRPLRQRPPLRWSWHLSQRPCQHLRRLQRQWLPLPPACPRSRHLHCR